ncbi:MAG: hypothetical protein DRO99_02350 [Candidatus Aenigmatarchaeota archaeon]|nr:MAG: hypothetical protein DRO99_02350 [Candidatus Aenigmarchaeota archaeon]
MPRKLVIVGFDGASFDFIKPVIDELPSFKKLIERGTHGRLESTIPPITIPAWPSMSTGLNPGKLGVFDFRYMNDDYSFHTVDGSDIAGVPFWEYAGKKYKVAIANVPGTWPPSDVNGFLVTGMTTPEGREFTYPKEFAGEIESEIPGYADTFGASGKDPSKVYITFEKRMLLLEYLIKKDADVLFFVFRIPDEFSHKKTISKEDMPECYRTMDRALGKIIKMSEGSNIMVVSDHGFEFNESEPFFVNDWLRKRGYLKLKGRASLLAKRALFKARKKPAYIYDLIDGKKTKAFSYNISSARSFGVWVNMEGRFKEGAVKDREGVVNSIVKDLASDPNIERVLKADDIYSGENRKHLPDIVAFSKGPAYTTVFPTETEKGIHSTHGIFIAHGPDIAVGKEIANARITDIAPTVLHLLGIRVPDNMDGEPLDIFEGRSGISRKVSYVKASKAKKKKSVRSKDDEEKMRQRLKELGYI